jgi:diguanylate cyclase (GGDEF)-like protein
VSVVAVEQIGRKGHQALIMCALKLSAPETHPLKRELDRRVLLADFAEFDLGVLVTIVVAVSTVLALIAVPTVLLARRFMMHEQLLAQARVDTKTGLLNASTWETEAAAEVVRAVRMRTPASVALIDIDHFKLVNDTHGHLVGDVALRAVTDAIREHLRSYDLAGRFGGEEFVVLLPNAGEAAAVSIAERLRTHIADLSIPADPTGTNSAVIRLTISVGVATLDEERRELTDLMAAADAALYQAKQSGRNRTRVNPSKAPAGQPATEGQPTATQHPTAASR